MSLHDLFHWMRRSAENSRKTAKAAKRQRKSNRLRVNQLERRELLSYWLPLTTAPTGTSGIQNMMLLSDGTVMALGNPNAGSNGTSNAWFQLKPDAQGNYVDGSWTALRPMSVSRLFFPSTVLPNGNVLVLGGEFSSAGSDTNTGESFNPTTNGTGKWTTITSYPFQANFGDEPTEVLNSTTVLTGGGRV